MFLDRLKTHTQHYKEATSAMFCFCCQYLLLLTVVYIVPHRETSSFITMTLYIPQRSKATLILTTLLTANYHSLKYDQKEMWGKSKIITSISMFPQSTTTKKSQRVFCIEIVSWWYFYAHFYCMIAVNVPFLMSLPSMLFDLFTKTR